MSAHAEWRVVPDGFASAFVPVEADEPSRAERARLHRVIERPLVPAPFDEPGRASQSHIPLPGRHRPHRRRAGYDAGKKIKGKKRHIGVDTLGLMHALVVLPANFQDRDVIAALLKPATARLPSLERAIANGGYQGATTAAAVQAEAGIPLEIVKRSDQVAGFKFLPKRWIVERTFK